MSKSIWPWWRKDRWGYPMEYEIGHPFKNLIRLIIMNLKKALAELND